MYVDHLAYGGRPGDLTPDALFREQYQTIQSEERAKAHGRKPVRDPRGTSRSVAERDQAMAAAARFFGA